MGNSQNDSFMLEKLIGGRTVGSVLCGVLLVLPTVIARDDNAYWLVAQVVSLVLLTVLVVRPKLPEPACELLVISISPTSALSLIAISNAAFWISYLLWTWGIQEKVLGWPSELGSGSPFISVAIVWLLALVPFSIYETFCFLNSFFSGSKRPRVWASIGSLALVGQLGTMKFIYDAIEGV